MSARSIQQHLFRAQEARDPGNAGTINADRAEMLVQLVSAGAETRTLARPTRAGSSITLNFRTDGGDITLTVTGGYNEDGATSFVFSDAGQFAEFRAYFDGTSFYWRMLSSHQTSNLSALTASAAEVNQAVGDGDEVVTTTNVIAATENGKTFYLNAVGGFTSTLPAPALGLRFRFIVKTAPTTAYIIATNGGADILFGMMLQRADGAGVAGAAQDVFNFVASQAIVGDWAEFYSDGTNWYYHGMVNVAAGNTTGQT